MPCEMKSKMIDGKRWTTMQMSATRALMLHSRLLPAFLQGIGPVFASLGKPDAEQLDAMSQAFSAISKAIPPAEFVAIVKELCEEAAIDGKRVDFDQAFSGGGGMVTCYKVAWFVLEANFSELFREVAPDGARERAQSLLMQKMAGSTPEAA